MKDGRALDTSKCSQKERKRWEESKKQERAVSNLQVKAVRRLGTAGSKALNRRDAGFSVVTRGREGLSG